jgi:hypothetical protein
MILLSSHLDSVKPFNLKVSGTSLSGLLDNQAGVIATYVALFQHPGLMELLESGRLKIFHSQMEEYGLDDLPNLGKEDIAVVMDVCNHREGFDISIENLANFPKSFAPELVDFMDGEDFQYQVRPYTGADEDADEAFLWHDKGIRTMSLILPVVGNYHTNDCRCPLTTLNRYSRSVARIVSFLLSY